MRGEGREERGERIGEKGERRGETRIKSNVQTLVEFCANLGKSGTIVWRKQDVHTNRHTHC